MAAGSRSVLVELAALAAAVGAVTPVLQVLAFGGVVGQIDRAIVGGYGFLASPELVEQVRGGGSGRLEAAGVLAGLLEQGVERGETGCGTLDLCGAYGLVPGAGGLVWPDRIRRPLIRVGVMRTYTSRAPPAHGSGCAPSSRCFTSRSSVTSRA